MTASLLERKLKWMVERYRAVVDKMALSGFGNDETDPPSIRETQKKMFKFFPELHRFLGTKSNHVPGLIVQYQKRGGTTAQDVNRAYGQVEENRQHVDASSAQKDGGNSGARASGEGCEGVERSGEGTPCSERNEDDNEEDEITPHLNGGNNSGRGEDTGSQQRRKQKRSASLSFESDSDVDTDNPAKKARISKQGDVRAGQSKTQSAGSSGNGKRSADGSVSRKGQARVDFVQKMTENNMVFTNNAQKSFEKSIVVMQEDVTLRREEVTLRREEVTLRREEVGVLRREAFVKENELKIKENEMKMKQIQTQENALRQQAMMFKSWGEDDEARRCMEEARALSKKLGEIGSQP